MKFNEDTMASMTAAGVILLGVSTLGGMFFLGGTYYRDTINKDCHYYGHAHTDKYSMVCVEEFNRNPTPRPDKAE